MACIWQGSILFGDAAAAVRELEVHAGEMLFGNLPLFDDRRESERGSGIRIGAHLDCQSIYPLGLGSFFAFFVPFARANNRHFPFRDELFVMHSFEVFLQARTVNDLNGVVD